MDSSSALMMAGGLPVPVNAERVKQKLGDLSPAKETGRKNLGIFLIVLAFVALFGGMGAAFVFINMEILGPVIPCIAVGFVIYFSAPR